MTYTIYLDPEEHETVQLRDDTKTFHKKITGTLVGELKQMYNPWLKIKPYLETTMIANNVAKHLSHLKSFRKGQLLA